MPKCLAQWNDWHHLYIKQWLTFLGIFICTEQSTAFPSIYHNEIYLLSTIYLSVCLSIYQSFIYLSSIHLSTNHLSIFICLSIIYLPSIIYLLSFWLIVLYLRTSVFKPIKSILKTIITVITVEQCIRHCLVTEETPLSSTDLQNPHGKLHKKNGAIQRAKHCILLCFSVKE